MKTLEQYMKLPYMIVIDESDDDGGFVAHAPELTGCWAHGRDLAAAYAALREAMCLWIIDALERGHTVPEPKFLMAAPAGGPL